MNKKILLRHENSEKGITLIALVITIVILIILATISINFVFNGGLIDRAEQARDYYQNDEAYTDESVTNLTGYIDGLINGIEGGAGGSGAGEGTTTEDGVPIPAGFYYVGGTKEEGVVISDAPEDEGKGTSHAVAQTLVGNQFVWIPVEDDSAFERYDGYYNGKLQNETVSGFFEACSEPYAGGYTNEQSEFEAMKASVLANNGFYVGRYETGVDLDQVDMDSIEEIGIVEATMNATVVKQGEQVFNGIGWNDSGDMNDETGGAVELSKGFAEANGYTSVTSTLIYGVQWDAIMNFIDPAYETGSCDTSSSFVANSTGKGWYDQSAPTTTGSNESYAVKNIYDLGGNVFEWTMEAYGTRKRVPRGGGYGDSGLESPASFRNDYVPSDGGGNLGFRLALYL